EAINTFMRLTVGDGHVSQIPDLLIAIANGIVVTRITTNGILGTDITKQHFRYPKFLFLVAGTVFLLGLTPINLLLTSFLVLFLAGSGYMLLQRAKVPEEQEEELDEVDSDTMRSQENVVNLLSIDPIEFEFGYALIPLVDASQG